MTRGGFFTRSERKQPRTRHGRVSIETLHQMGPKAVRGMNPDALHPEMQPELPASGRCEVFFLGEAPGAEEDEQGRPFVGRSGQLLRSCIPRFYLKRCGFGNVVGTRPPGNRTPTETEIEAFRPEVVRQIEQAKPSVVVAVGLIAARWAIPATVSIKAARGRRFPVRIGTHTCWVMPILHPAFMLRIERKREDKVPGEEWMRYFRRDIEAVFDEDLPEPTLPTHDEVMDGLQVETTSDPTVICSELRKLRATRHTIAFDLETKNLRPYRSDSKILSIAFSTGRHSLAFGIDHSEVRWKRGARDQVHKELFLLFTSGKRFVAHKLAFDLEWMVWFLGSVILSKSEWDDTLSAGFVLDERQGGLSLNFLCAEAFGIQLKQLTEGGSRRDDLDSLDLRKVLTYNALDAKFTWKLHHHLAKRIRAEKLEETYRAHVRRISAVVESQRIGVPVHEPTVVKFEEEYRVELERLTKAMRKLPEVRILERKIGKEFQPTAVKEHVLPILRDILRVDEVQVRDRRGKVVGYTTDESVLSQLRERLPFADYLLKHRRISKLKGTYVDSMLRSSPKTVVYPDGLIHCQFNTCRTGTGRISSEDPNNQNWPKRRNREVRKQIRPARGHTLVAADAGQIEARVIAMFSRDPTFTAALWEDYDVHLEWAKRVAKLHPPCLAKYGGDLKKFRSAIKNELVFPAFYLASEESLARYLELPAEKAHRLFSAFWNEFAGIRKWQAEMMAAYARDGYVTSLTGRRRRGPLSESMIVNTPVQGTASDIVVEAWCDLSEESRASGRPWLQPIIQIHDDLTFVVPDEHVEEAIEEIVRAMLVIRWDWITVPLSVEVEIGKDWGMMESVGVFRSDRI